MEENGCGRFLKGHSGQDKTRAGKMMAAVGKSQSFAAQQRLVVVCVAVLVVMLGF